MNMRDELGLVGELGQHRLDGDQAVVLGSLPRSRATQTVAMPPRPMRSTSSQSPSQEPCLSSSVINGNACDGFRKPYPGAAGHGEQLRRAPPGSFCPIARVGRQSPVAAIRPPCRRHSKTSPKAVYSDRHVESREQLGTGEKREAADRRRSQGPRRGGGGQGRHHRPGHQGRLQGGQEHQAGLPAGGRRPPARRLPRLARTPSTRRPPTEEDGRRGTW